MTAPFLLKFAQPCLSPRRTPVNQDYTYDESVDMVRWEGSPERPFAIDVQGEKGPITKKADIEKGDDEKDLRMWA